MAELDVVIRNGEIVTAAGSEGNADIGITGGIIVQIGGAIEGRQELDAASKLVLPGGVDAHVHLSFPGEENATPGWVDDFASGSAAALAGGITTLGNMTFPLPGETPLAALTDSDTVALHRIEISRMSGSGRLRVTGKPDRAMKDSILTAFDHIKANKTRLGIERDVDSYDFHVQIVDLMHRKEGSQVGVAFFVALYSLLREKPVQASLVVLGEMTIQGNVLPVRSLVEPLQVIMDNGAKRVLIPLSNRRHFMEVPPDVLEKVDPIFYSEPLAAALKALGMG